MSINEHSNTRFQPVRRSSTLRSDEWDYRNPRIPDGRVRYDDYRPRDDYKPPYETVEVVYDRPSRPVIYQPNDHYDRWQDNPGQVVRPRPRSPSPMSLERYELERKLEEHRRQLEALRFSGLDRDNDERRIIAERSRGVNTKSVPPVEHVEASKVQNEPQHIPGLFQTIFDVNHPQDASVHLELPITDDHETDLEEFCRLQRLGNFSAAEDYFKDKLEPYLSNPYVFVHFGQMLLDKGDYLAFARLNTEAVFGKEDRPPLRSHDGTVVVERNGSRSRIRPRSRSRSRERRRGAEARSRSPSPADGGRQERRARFESDVRIVRRRSRSRSVDSIRGYHGRERDDGSDRSPSPDNGPNSKDTKPNSEYYELELLRQNWRLLKATCAIYSEGHFEDAFTEAWYTIINFRFGTVIGSTEAQIVKLALHLCANIRRVGPEWYHGEFREDAREWFDWTALFKELLAQGRIWDFKDLYVAAVAAFSDSGETLFFGTDGTKRSLIDDWVLEEGDESTNLALLDMILEPGQLRSMFPNEAKSRAEAIIAHSPAVMRSRSFIRWILANAADALSSEKKGENDLWLAHKTHIQGFPGMVWVSQDCFLPGIYVPRNTENPGWVAPELSLGVTEPIKLALNLAKELKDYKSQVACYKLLIFQSQDPTQLFQDLAHFQKFTQGDKAGHLRTLLSSYLVCKDRPAKESLLAQLEQTDDWDDPRALHDGPTYCARDVIERALKRSLQGPKSTARLRNPPSFYTGMGLPWEDELFTNSPDDTHPKGFSQSMSCIEKGCKEPRLGGRDRIRQCLGHWTREVRDRVASEVSNRAERERLQLEDEIYELEYRERVRLAAEREQRRLADEEARRAEQLRQAKVEIERKRLIEDLAKAEEERRRHEDEERLDLTRKKQDHRIRNQQDREMQERLEQAEQRWRDQEEINKRQLEDMKKRDVDMKRLAEEFKSAKEKQEREARAQQERETRERLERTELSLRDQEERLRRAEDRSHQEWLAERNTRNLEKVDGKGIRRRGEDSVATVSRDSSDSYSSGTWSSQDDEDFDSDIPQKKVTQKDKLEVSKSDGEDELEQDARMHLRRLRSVEELGNEPRENEADHHEGGNTGNIQQNPCTDLIVYDRNQTLRPPDAYTAGSTLPRSPTLPHLHGEANEDLQKTNPKTTYGTTTEAGSHYPPAAQSLRREELDDLYKSVRSIGIDERETSVQREVRREKKRDDRELRDRLKKRFSAHYRPSSSDMSPSRFIYEKESRGGNEAQAGRKGKYTRGPVKPPTKTPFESSIILIQDQEPARKNIQIYTQEQADHLTSEPQVVDQPDQAGRDALKISDENDGRPRLHRSESRHRDELQSEQNEKIANRPSRPPSIGRYGSPRAGVWGSWEESGGNKPHRRVIIDPSPSSVHTAPVSARARSRPSSTQDLDGIQPVGRSTSWRDSPAAPSSGERRPSPVKRRSLIIDPDGRPRPMPIPIPIPKRSEYRRSYSHDTGPGPYVVTRRGASADGRRSMPEMPPPPAAAALASRPHSTVDVGARRHPLGPEPSIPDKLPSENWEQGTDGFWRKKKAVSIVHEDPEEGDEWGTSQPQPRTSEGESSKLQAPLDPEQGISRKSTVADPEPNEE